MPGYLAALQATQGPAPAAPPSSGGDSFFGIHLPNLGLGQLPGMVGGAVKTLWGLGPGALTDVATGHFGDAVQNYRNVGQGILTGLYNTEAHVGGLIGDAHIPILSPAVGNFFKNTTNQWGNYLAQTSGTSNPAAQQAIYNSEVAAGSPSAYQHAFIPTAINDLGSASIVGGAAEKALSLGDVGAAASAGVAAENAAKAGITPEELSNASDIAKQATPLQKATANIPILRRFTAGDLASMPPALRDAALAGAKDTAVDLDPAAVAERAGMIRNAQALGSPLKSIASGVLGPLGRAAADANVADAASSLSKPAEVADEAAPAAEAATEAADETPGPRIGPKQRAFQYRNDQPIPQWAQAAVSRVPSPVRDILQTVEGLAQSHGIKVVAKEQRRFVESARRSVLYGPAMEDATSAAADVLANKRLPDGTKIRPADAESMVGEEIISRLTTQHQMGEALKIEHPELAPAIDAAMKQGTHGGIPTEMMTPELDAKLNDAVSKFVDLRQQARETMLTSRRGDEGLTNQGDQVIPTSAQARESAAIDRERQSILNLVPRKNAELDRVRQQTIDLSSKAQRVADEHDRILQTSRANRLQVASDVAERPDLFDPSKGINFLGDKSVGQIAQQLKQRIGETPAQLKARAVRVGRGIERDANLQARAARLVRQGNSLDKAQGDLFDTLTNQRTPTAQAIVSRYGKLQTRSERLRSALEHPSTAQVPAAWQPLYASWKGLRTELSKTPGGAEALASMPEEFSKVVERAKQYGFDPTHVASMSEDQVRRLVNNPVQLFNKDRVFQTVKSGQRQVRQGAQARTQSLSALAAAQVDVVHEAASNEVVSYIEHNVARPMLKDAAGNAYTAPGWHEWSPVKSFILNGKDAEEGGKVFDAGHGQPDMMIPDSAFKAIQNMSGSFNHSMFTNLGKITAPWRALVLTYSPGWYLKHFIGHAVLATTQGVRLGDWAAAWDSLRADKSTPLDKVMQYIAGRDGYKASDVAPEGLNGVGGTSLYSDLTGEKALFRGPETIRGQAKLATDLSDGGKFSSKAAGLRAGAAELQRKAQRINEVGDNLGRAAMYLSQRRAGVLPEAALQKSVEALVDYNDLTSAERTIVRSFVPFYAFQKGMFKIMARLPIDHPIATAAGIQMAKLQNDMSGLPSYYSGMIHVPGTNLNVNTRSFDPFADATSLATPQGIAQGMNPYMTIFLNNALGVSSNPKNKMFRVDEFGHAVPDTGTAGQTAGIFTGVPLATSIGGLTGGGAQGSTKVTNALKAGGVSSYTPAMVQALLQRQQKAQLIQQTGNQFAKAPGSTPTPFTGPGSQFLASANSSSSQKPTFNGPGSRFLKKPSARRGGTRSRSRSPRKPAIHAAGVHSSRVRSARISSHSSGSHTRFHVPSVHVPHISIARPKH